MRAFKMVALAAFMQILILFANRMRIEYGRANADMMRR